VRLGRLFHTTAPSPPSRRRRRRRTDAPQTIVPLPEHPAGRVDRTPFAFDVDAARDRLRRAIPPVDDEED
jgi:hypothetical protein